MDNKSIMGYRRDSPYKNDPFIDIFSPQGLIDMSATDIDLVGTDEYGNRKVMKANSKNPYKFEGQHITEHPYKMAQGGISLQQVQEWFDDDDDEDLPAQEQSEEDPTDEKNMLAHEKAARVAMEMEQQELAMQEANNSLFDNPYKRREAYGDGLDLGDDVEFTPEQTSQSEKEAYQFFLNKGYSPEAAAGLVGNIKHESNFNPYAVGDGGKARGFAQWHPDRYGPLSKKFDLQSFTGNLEAIDYELRNSETQAFSKILKARSPEEAAQLVDKHYERSAGYSTGKRMNTARNIYNNY